MIYRLVILLTCVVVFINSCNSLISLQFGTHKLRTFSMETALSEGIGDSDYLELSDAWTNGEFYHVPGKHAKDGGLILYPILSESQVEAVDSGQKVMPYFVAWTQTFPWECLEQNNCVKKEKLVITGVIRELKEEDQQLDQLPDHYNFDQNKVVYLEVGRAPTAWYWHLLFLGAAAGIAFAIELVKNKKRLKNE
ncbi:MAG: hypothetical protein DHS20C18_43120 [Saprospiraceae bacterium]|nr:MAG: hypothetical protein DHS20C18_43120 [Saprospiraceae bacterium]